MTTYFTSEKTLHNVSDVVRRFLDFVLVWQVNGRDATSELGCVKRCSWTEVASKEAEVILW